LYSALRENTANALNETQCHSLDPSFWALPPLQNSNGHCISGVR